MARTIGSHELTHVVIELLAVFLQSHVYEVNHNDAAHVAQAELAGNFVGCPQIHLDSIALLVGRCTRAVARVYIDDMKGLGMLDNDIGAGAEADSLAKRSFDLARYAESIENRFVFGIEFDYVGLFGSNEIDVAEKLAIGVGVIYVNGLEGFGIEHVAEHTDRAPCFFIDGGWGGVEIFAGIS